jgi:Zn-dependent M16 (insulinase) family peptidase
VYVGSGSQNETALNNGAAHAIEHMLFKGTDKYSAGQLADIMTELGGGINAYTSKENTVFYGKVLPEDFERALSVMSDMLFNSVFDPKEFSKEKGVIIDEIDSYDDSAEDMCHELLQKRLLKQTKSEINTEKLQAAKTEAKAALVSKIGSLLGSGKLKEVEQHNKKLCELVTDREQYIDELHEKIQRMEDRHSGQLSEVQQKHQSEVMELKNKHATDVSFLNGIICKAKQWFPRLEALLQIENLCRKIGFTTEQTEQLLTGKALNFSGSLYSDEHRKKFIVKNAEIKVFPTSAKPNLLILAVNRQPITEWFKEQWDSLKSRIYTRGRKFGI